MAQVAFRLMVLAGAGLFIGTLRNLRTMDAGFERAGILLSTIEPGAAGYHGPAAGRFLRALLLRVGQLPGVRAADFR